MNAKILVVDDEPNNQRVYERVLAPLKLDIVRAMSGQQALSVAHKHDFFLILMDVQMPGIDGFETASLILDHPHTSHIPIIFITAYARDEAFEFKGYTCGAVDYMIKPINDEVLRHKVQVFLNLYSERRRLKKALDYIQVSEQRYRTLFERSNDAIFVMGRKSRCYLDANAAASRLTGCSLEELQSLTCDEVIPEEITSQFEQVTQSLPRMDFGEVVFSKKGAKSRQAHFTTFYMDEDTLVGIARDITDEQNMQRQLRRTEKMDAVGQLTGGIAHDFNNILSIIIGNVELIQLEIDPSDKIAKKVDSILKSAERAAELTGQLLRFSGRQAVTDAAVNINDVIEQMDTLIGSSVTPQIQIEHHCAEDLWLTSIDSGDFQDALLNLVINAHDALAGAGVITLETSNCHIDTAFCKLNPGAAVGDYVQLAVSDTGEGMLPEVQERCPGSDSRETF